MQDSNFIRNFIIHSYPATMGINSQDLFILVLPTKTLHLIMKFLFFAPQLSSHLRIAELVLGSWNLITPDLAVHDNKETAEKN